MPERPEPGQAPRRGWTSAPSAAGYAISAVLLAAFIADEGRRAEPMLDVRLFRDMGFTKASVTVTIAFFTLLGFVFLMTQFFQFIRTYSALSTGVHLLPVAVSVAVGSTLGTRLTVRVSTKLVVTAGLALMAIFCFWAASDISATLGYGVIAAQMVVYGLGMGFSSAPATESIMDVVAGDKAGVGSAVNDSTRLLGGTLGVAVIGSVYASLYSSRLKTSLPAALPRPLTATTHQSMGAAFEVASRLAAKGRPPPPPQCTPCPLTPFSTG